MLHHVVDDDEGMTAPVAEIFRHGKAGKGRDPLQAGRDGGGRDDEDAALRRPVLAHRVDRPLDGRGPLANGDIDADHVAVALVDDGIDGKRGLAGGPVADDEFALAAAEGEQRIDDEDAGLHGRGDEIPVDDGRRRPLDRMVRGGLDRRIVVERPAERIDNAAEQPLAHRHPDHLAGAGHPHARLDLCRLVENDGGDPVFIEGQREAVAVALEPQQLVEPGIRQARDEGDAVADALHPADGLRLRPEPRPGDRVAAALQPFLAGRIRRRHGVSAPLEVFPGRPESCCARTHGGR